MTNIEIIQALRGTKERLFTHGWQQDRAGGESGPNCLLGAISWVVTSNQGSYDAVREALGEERVGLSAIVEFNDAPGTTFDDVLDYLDSHIKRLEEV